MKKLVLTLAIVFAGIMSANAQWIGGGVGAEVYKGHTAFAISPEFGYNINDQWAVALGATYGFAQESFEGLSATANLLYLQPYVRYVGGTIGKKFSLFLDLTGDFGLIDASGWAVNLRPGIAWQATDQFTAAFRFGFAGYDHGLFQDHDGFYMNCELVAPEIRLYYNF
ncbi:MAG: hypothetical protein IKM99_08430 [Bacteroidales bacterium]|nr:hypothetical protein [Bacteroidales bacterium]